MSTNYELSRAKVLLQSDYGVNQKIGVALVSSVGGPEQDTELKTLLSNSSQKLAWCLFYHLQTHIEQIYIKGAEYTGSSDLKILEQFPNLTKVYITEKGYRGQNYFHKKEKMLPKLKVLSLARNEMGFPSGVCYHTNLEKLYLNHNLIGKIPAEIHQLKQLKVLSLSHNRMHRVSSYLGCLRELEILNLSHNYLKSFSGGVETLPKLEILNISHNYIQELPNWIHKMTNLKQLNIRQNKLSELPECIEQMTHLETLYLEGNPVCKDSRYMDYLEACLPNTIIKY